MCLLDLQPENLLAVEIEGYTVPEIKLIHFERSREVNADSDIIVRRLDEHIEYEGIYDRRMFVDSANKPSTYSYSSRDPAG